MSIKSPILTTGKIVSSSVPDSCLGDRLAPLTFIPLTFQQTQGLVTPVNKHCTNYDGPKLSFPCFHCKTLWFSLYCKAGAHNPRWAMGSCVKSSMAITPMQHLYMSAVHSEEGQRNILNGSVHWNMVWSSLLALIYLHYILILHILCKASSQMWSHWCEAMVSKVYYCTTIWNLCKGTSRFTHWSTINAVRGDTLTAIKKSKANGT